MLELVTFDSGQIIKELDRLTSIWAKVQQLHPFKAMTLAQALLLVQLIFPEQVEQEQGEQEQMEQVEASTSAM